MSYAGVAATERPGRRLAAEINPLRHLSHLQGNSMLVDLKTVKPNFSKLERFDFVIKDLAIPAEEVLCIFVDHISQLLVLTVESEAVYKAALERLHVGVPWAAAGGAPVYGSSSSEAVSTVRVSNIPIGLAPSLVLAHMRRFGTVLTHSMGRDRLFPRASDGVLHITMLLNDEVTLPYYIQVVDDKNRLSNSLPVHMDAPRRRCYRCGRPNHLGFRCQAASRAPDAPASTWSVLVAPPPPAAVSNILQAIERPQGASGGGDRPLPLPVQPAAAPKAQQADTQAAGGKENRKRPHATSPTSSQGTGTSSERRRSVSPSKPKTDADGFTTVARGRRKKMAADKAANQGEEAPAGQEEAVKLPLAAPVPPRSSLEDLIITPAQEGGGASGDGDDGRG